MLSLCRVQSELTNELLTHTRGQFHNIGISEIISSSSNSEGHCGEHHELSCKKIHQLPVEKVGLAFPSPLPRKHNVLDFPADTKKTLSSWVCQIDCFCFTLLESEHEWWAVILSWISKSAFSSKWSLCYSQVKTRLMQIFQMHEKIPNGKNSKFDFIWRMLACMQMVLFSFSNDLPLPCVCTVILHIPHSTSFFLHLGKIVFFYILVKGTLLVIKYTMCPRIAGIIFY